MRNSLYQLARLLGDIMALFSGRATRRYYRKKAGRKSGNFMNKIFK